MYSRQSAKDSANKFMVTTHYLLSTFRVCIGDPDTLHLAYERSHGRDPRPPTPDRELPPLELTCAKGRTAEPQDGADVRCTGREQH